jgi:hypothetical protein
MNIRHQVGSHRNSKDGTIVLITSLNHFNRTFTKFYNRSHHGKTADRTRCDDRRSMLASLAART